jgi:hypothetical protein
MTEAEWLTCEDPGFMLDHIENKASDRKLRLFAVACCRRMWHLLTDERSRRAVEVTEQYADELASSQAFQAAMESACRVDEGQDNGEPTPGTAAALIAYSPPFDAAYTCGTVSVLVDRERMKNQPDWWAKHEKEGEEEARRQAPLLRCIFGNPFHPAPVLAPGWLAWNDGAVSKMARMIYDGCRFADLPVLADALEDAGCTDAAILTHCRSGGEHVRGCWVIDLLLGKA